jgi:hypothetical protein
MNKPEEKSPEGMNFGFVLWAIWNVVFFTLMWRARHTLPLWWPGTPSLGKLILFGAMMGIGTLYVWWANRRDSK